MTECGADLGGRLRVGDGPVEYSHAPTWEAEIEEAHLAACEAGRPTYPDPATGYMVQTTTALEQRGFCCSNACRHCPFGHMEVMPDRTPTGSTPKTVLFARFRKGRRAKLTVGAKWDTFRDRGRPRLVLFWSGGKDSFLALRVLQEKNSRQSDRDRVSITLLTTFDGASGAIAFQDTKISDVMLQAQREGIDILVVPLRSSYGPTCQSYQQTVLAALKPLNVQALAFGDLRLQDIRQWREDTFSTTFPLRFPVFGVPYENLLPRLWAEQKRGVTIRVSSVSPELVGRDGLEVGLVYNEDFIAGLPAGIDIMGENGEFHTHVGHDEWGPENEDEPTVSGYGDADSESDSSVGSG